jgi:DegV family protein with EDD domain
MRRKVAIVTDSASDLTPELLEAHAITVVPLNVHFGQETFRDGVDLSPEEFMQRLVDADRQPTTSQPAVAVFEETFRTLAASHDGIVAVLGSSKLSGATQSATLAAEAVADVIPVEIVDSLNVTYGLGLQAIRAAQLANEGQPAATIAATLRTEIDQYHVILFVENMDYLRRGGSIGKATQLVGTALNIKPVLRVEEGQIVPFERTRTRARAIAALVEFTRELGPVDQAGVIFNTTDDDARDLADQVGAVTGIPNPPSVRFGPVLSTHLGPGVLGVTLKEAKRD